MLTSAFGYAQVSRAYKSLAKEESANYKTIVRQARIEFAAQDQSVLANKKAKKQFERWAHYWENRVNPDGTFPNENTGYFNAGILDSNGKIAQRPENNYAPTNTLNNQNWTNVGPEQSELNNNGYSNYPQMGRLNTLLRIKHPTDTNQDVLFVGAPNGGVWKSTDGGTNWTPKLDNVAGIGVTDIKTVPGTTTANYTTTPIYVSTGDYDGPHSNSIGVLKSTDGGETFVSTGLSYSIDQEVLTGDLVVIDANTVFVGTDRIMKTVNGGTSWTSAYTPPYTNLKIGRAARNGNEIMFTGNANDVYYTTDYTNDANWTTVVNPTNPPSKAAVTVDANGDFYIQIQDQRDQNNNYVSGGNVQKFDKNNSTFSNVGSVPQNYNSQGGYNQALIVTNDLIISGEFNGTHSVDNGANWYRSLNGYWSNPANPPNTTADGTYIHSDHHRMGKLDANTDFWSVNDGGLHYISYPNFAADAKPTITYKSGKVKVTQSYSIAINPKANDGALMMANQDNDAYSKHNGNWYAVAQGDGIQSAINYNNPAERYAGNHTGAISHSTTGFQGELNGDNKWARVPGAQFYFPMEIHKTNPSILYGGGNDVYEMDFSAAPSGPGGNTPSINATALNSGLGDVKSIAAHTNAIMAASKSEIKLLPQGASNWINVPASGITGDITSVDFDSSGGPGDPYYATVKGYSAGNKVFKTTDGGTTWTNISGNLPNIVVNEVMLKQNQTQEYLFVATELGVYYTANGGTSWAKLGNGMPNVNVKDIEIHYTADKLVAGTFGRGAWEISIVNSTLGNADVLKQAKGISVYPNPASQKVHIDTPSGEYEYLMYNVVGGIVKQGVVSDKGIDVSNLASNVYILRVFNDDSNFSQKILVE